MRLIISTGIIADQPTAAGSIYPRAVLDDAIKKFNITAQNNHNNGSLLDPLEIDKIGPETHRTKSMFINDSGVLCAVVDITDKDLVERLSNNNTKIIARPIMAVPSSAVDSKPFIATFIDRIVRVQLECSNGESERSQVDDKESGSS